MMYNPDNELTQEQLDELSEKDFDAFLAYIDSKANYLKQRTGPLNQYYSKRFAALDEAIRKTEKSK
jgi:hypothetical protein